MTLHIFFNEYQPYSYKVLTFNSFNFFFLLFLGRKFLCNVINSTNKKRESILNVVQWWNLPDKIQHFKFCSLSQFNDNKNRKGQDRNYFSLSITPHTYLIPCFSLVSWVTCSTSFPKNKSVSSALLLYLLDFDWNQ